jgi:hypothetical protein
MNIGNVLKKSSAFLLIAGMAMTVVVAAHAQTEPSDLDIISELTGMQASHRPLGPEWFFDEEHQVYLAEPQWQAMVHDPDPAARERARTMLNTQGLLLIPDSTNKRIMAFDPDTGDLVDPDFMLLDEDATGTVIHAILGMNDNILISDQTRNVVHNYDLEGNYLGAFAPAGGANTAIMQNIRGIALRPNGNLLVSVGGGTNANAIAQFDADGNYIGNFVPNASGGLNSPFEVYQRLDTDWLVSSINSNQVLSYELDSGDFKGEFAPISSFPQQIYELPGGNVLVGNFSGTPGVHEFTAAGDPVGVYNPVGVSNYRGVYELPGGSILTTTSGGVFEIDRASNLIDTKYTGQSRFIEYVVIETVAIDDQPGDEVPPAAPAALAISKVAPNPFNPMTAIHFDLPRSQRVTVSIHDLRGRLVRTVMQGSLENGSHETAWDGLDAHGSAVPSGVYLVRLTTADGLQRTMKMTLAR